MGEESGVKNNTNEIQWPVKKSEWKTTEIWKAKGKGDGHQHRLKPVLIAWKLT